MDFPRIIIADERRPGKVPAGVLLAFALKKMGYKLRVFAGSIDEVSMRALTLMSGDPVTLIDPVLCNSKESVRRLFQCAASSECINLILVPLGGRWTEDAPFKVSQESLLLSKWLDCGMVLIPYGDTSAMVTTRAVSEIITQIDANSGVVVRGIMFMGLPNPKEYELLDMGIGRKVHWNSLGYIPQMNEREFASITQLCTQEGKSSLLPVLSTATQLVGMGRQVNWSLFRAFAVADSHWAPEGPLAPPVETAYSIAVIQHPALGLAGNGTEILLKDLGCTIVPVSLDEVNDVFPVVNGVYLPHGLAYLCFAKFYANVFVKTLINKALSGRFFLFAEGATAPLLGEKVKLYNGDEVRGFGLLPIRSVYRSGTFSAPYKRYAQAVKMNPLLRAKGDTVYGYGSANLVMTSDSLDDFCWELVNPVNDKVLDKDGWSRGMVLASQMRLEFWSCPKLLKTWLDRWDENNG